VERLLFRFSKGEPVRFVGHLDLMRVVERAIRRSRFPIAYSQGFNPRPRMAFASALTLGATSDWELCQLDLADDLDENTVEAAVVQLREALPPGVIIHEVWPLPVEKKNPYIQVKAAEYELTLTGEGVGADEALSGRIRQFFQEGRGLPEPEWVGERPDARVLRITLPVGERSGVRVRDLIAELEEALPGLRVPRLHRARLWCERAPATDKECSGDVES
jgi:hypothetical protein